MEIGVSLFSHPTFPHVTVTLKARLTTSASAECGDGACLICGMNGVLTSRPTTFHRRHSLTCGAGSSEAGEIWTPTGGSSHQIVLCGRTWKPIRGYSKWWQRRSPVETFKTPSSRPVGISWVNYAPRGNNGSWTELESERR